MILAFFLTIRSLFRRKKTRLYHKGKSDAQPINGWESYIDHSLTHDEDGL